MNHYFCNLIAHFPCPSPKNSYELLMLLGRKIFSTTMIFLTWWWFPSQNKPGKKLCYQYHRKWMEKKVENTSRICMLKTRFKPMGRGVLPYLARVNNLCISILNRISFLAGSLDQEVNTDTVQSLSVYFKKFNYYFAISEALISQQSAHN